VPRLPGALGGFADRAVTDLVGDVLLATATVLCGLLALVIARRRRQAAPPRGGTAGAALSLAGVRRALARPPREPRPSDLGVRLRQAARTGERVPQLARRFHLSQDAVRAAIGHCASGPAAPTGKSFRSRKASLPAKPRALPVGPQPSPYRALA
jgi:hypothetical protein